MSLQASRSVEMGLRLHSPTKLNLFLHITGRRPDGYHLLESLFVPLDWTETLVLTPLDGPEIRRTGPIDWPVESDLAVRAARALQDHCRREGRAQPPGVEIHLQKCVPVGTGLGAGSANAAAVLRGLNQLWSLGLSTTELESLALPLGADVPFFVRGVSALASGVGEVLEPIEPACRWFVVGLPGVGVPTGPVFQSPLLRRDHPHVDRSRLVEILDDPRWTFGVNDLEAVTRTLVPAVGQLLNLMVGACEELGIPRLAARMSGSGGACFVSCQDRREAETLIACLADASVSAHERAETDFPPPSFRICEKLRL